MTSHAETDLVRVLIVEDNLMVAESVVRLLASRKIAEAQIKVISPHKADTALDLYPHVSFMITDGLNGDWKRVVQTVRDGLAGRVESVHISLLTSEPDRYRTQAEEAGVEMMDKAEIDEIFQLAARIARTLSSQ